MAIQHHAANKKSWEALLKPDVLRTLARSRGWPYLASWAHRITGVLLVLYVWFHIITLSSLSNPDDFDSKMKFFRVFLFVFLEWLLAAPVIYHALNGGRLILYEIFGNRKDQIVLQWVLVLSVFYTFLLGLFMAMGNQNISAIFFWVYVAVASGCITYLTVMKLRQSGASFAWKLQRITGAFLFLMIPAHMLFMHLDPALGHDAQVVIARMDNVFIKLVDLLLVFSVLYHGAYGLLGICQDYIPSRRTRIGCVAGLTVLMSIFALMGIKLVILI
jgi:succinate dehydrogenase / fumarate reductase cytochrome b subunit